MSADIDISRFDLTVLRLRPRTMPAALDRMKTWLEGQRSSGELLACLYSDLGTVNQLLLLRRFADTETLVAARDSAIREPDPFGVSEFTLGLTMNLMVAVPGLPAAGPGAHGPFFEIRSDEAKPGRLGQALASWQPAERGRTPLLGLYTLAADAPRIVHIWPSSGPDGSAGLPIADSPTDFGPDFGGASNLASQKAEIFRAAGFSPLR